MKSFFTGFKKVSDDGKVVTLRHEKGHEVRVVKHALDKKTRAALTSLPEHEEEAPENEKLTVAENYADGGEIKQKFAYGSDANTQPVKDPTEGMAQEDANASDAKTGAPVTINISSAPQPQQSASVAQAPTQAPAPALTGAQSLGQNVGEAVRHAFADSPIGLGARAAAAAAPYVKEGAQGLVSGVTGTPIPQAASAPAAAEAAPQNYVPPQDRAPQAAGIPEMVPQPPPLRGGPADHSQQIMQHVSDTFARERQRWEDEHQALTEDIANFHVDPNRLWNSKSSLDKVASTIGLLLGGITGNKGLLGTYGRLIQSEIDRDVESQREEMGKKKTLLEAHLKEFGNIKDAADVLRMNLLTAAQAKLANSEAFKQNAEAQKVYLELDQARQAVGQKLAVRKALMAGGSSPEVRAQSIRYLVPDKEQGNAFKELQTVETLKRSGDNALQAFDQLDHMFAAGLFSPHERDALVKPVIASLSKESAGRFTEQDARMIESLFPQTGDADKTRVTKRHKLISLLEEKMSAPLLSAYGVPVPRIEAMRRAAVPANWKQ